MEDVQIDESAASRVGPLDQTIGNTRPVPLPDTTAQTGVIGAVPQEKQQENKDYWEANINGTFGDAVARSIEHGDNIAVNVGKSLYRAWSTGEEDPNWDQERRKEWIEKNKKDIPDHQLYRYWGTRSAADADWMKAEATADRNAMRINEQLTGLKGYAASGIAGLIDIDTPLTLVTGGLSLGAKAGLSTIRRAAMGATSGAALGIGLGITDFVVNPNAEAESIAMFGLMGAGFGLIGAGRAGKTAGSDLLHGVKRDATEELGERLNGTGREVIDDVAPHADPDPYSVRSKPEGMPEEVVQGEAGKGTSPQAVKLDTPAPDSVEPALRGPVLAREASEIIDEATGKPMEGKGPVLARSTDEVIEESIPDAPFEGKGPKVGDIIGEQSIGARGPTQPGLKGITNTQYRGVAWKAEQWKKQQGSLFDAMDDGNYNHDNAVTKAAGIAGDRFSRMAQKLAITTDWDNFMRSGSAVAQKFAFDMFESASGIIRNAKSAAGLMETYRKELGKEFMPFVDHMKEYSAQVHNTDWRDNFFTDKGRKASQDFNEQVITELMARRYGGQGATHKSVIAAADAVDRTFALEVQVAQGRNGQLGITAWKDVKETKGYLPQSWSGEQMLRLLDAAQVQGGIKGRDLKKRQIIKLIDDDYARMHPTMDPKARRIYAEAVVDRALINRQSISRDILGLLSGDERDFVKSALVRNNMNPNEADRVIDALIGSRDSKGRPGHTQERIDVDFRTADPTSGLRMMDVLNTDIFGMVHKRIAKTSGQAAMARKGIGSRADFELIKASSIAEQEAKRAAGPMRQPGTVNAIKDRFSNPTEINEKYWDDVYSYFNGTPMAGGVSPGYARFKKLTGLATMNQLGLTSLSETGAIMGTVGWQHFARHAGPAIMESIKNAKSALSKEMEHFAVFVPEEGIWRPDMVFEHEKIHASGELMQKADMLLNKGQRAQGYLSGFFKIREMQQRMAITSATSRVFEGMKNTAKQFSPERLADMGLDVKSWQKYVDDGTVEFNSKGQLVKLNLDKWKYDDVEMYRVSMARTTNQLIQKAMAGESNVLFHRDGLAQLFWQFKSFPLLALEKQFNRNMRMADSAAIQTFMFGMITAGAAYSIKQVLNGNTDNLTTGKIARGAINYSNMAGWIGMWTDPVMGVLGLSDYNVSGYNGRGSSVISAPASLGVLDKLAQVPGSLARVATPGLSYTNADIRNLQTIPLFGNLYGVAYLLNTMKHTKESRAEEKRAEREAKKAETVAEPKAPKPAKPVKEEWTEEKLAKLAEKRGYANGAKYVEHNKDGGMSLMEIAKDLSDQ